MTLKEIYELIKQKKENAENEIKAHYKEAYEMFKRKELTQVKEIEIELKDRELKGEIEAYTDVLILIESSEVLENE